MLQGSLLSEYSLCSFYSFNATKLITTGEGGMVTTNNKDFFFSFKSIDSIPSGLYGMTYTDNNGFGLSKMDYKSEEFFHLPSLPHKQILKRPLYQTQL